MDDILIGFVKSLTRYGEIEFTKDVEIETGDDFFEKSISIVTFEKETYLVVMCNGNIERIEKIS